MLGDELPKSRDRLLDPRIGHVGQWDRLAVEYADLAYPVSSAGPLSRPAVSAYFVSG